MSERALRPAPRVSIAILAIAALALAACGGRRLPEPDPLPRPGPAPRPLTNAGYRVEWLRVEAPAEIAANGSASVLVELRNASPERWADLASAAASGPGPRPVRLAWRWKKPGEKLPPGEGYVGRAELPFPLGPGERTRLRFNLRSPAAPGEYLVELELVEELVAWFQAKGGATRTFPVRVK